MRCSTALLHGIGISLCVYLAAGCGTIGGSTLGSRQACSDHGICKTHSGCDDRTICHESFDKSWVHDKCFCDDCYEGLDCSRKKSVCAKVEGGIDFFFLVPAVMCGCCLVGIVACVMCTMAGGRGGSSNSGRSPNIQMSSTTPAYAMSPAQQPFMQPSAQMMAPSAPIMAQAMPMAQTIQATPMGGMGGMWNPNAMCDGSTAQERVNWLQQNQGLDVMSAQQKVMSEFPAMFSGGMQGGMQGGMYGGMQGGGMQGGMYGGMHGGPPGWNPNAICDSVRAEERANWLRDNKGYSVDMARQQVMSEFPMQFR